MLFFSYLFVYLACLLGLAAAKPEDHKSWVILRNLYVLKDNTQKLTDELSKWDKTMLGAEPLIVQTEIILDATRVATVDIREHSKKLGIQGALHVGKETKKLIKLIKASMKLMADLRFDMDHIEIATSVMNSLAEQRNASAEMNKAVVPKIPRIGRGIARKLGRRVSKQFTQDIHLYAEMLKAPEPKGFVVADEDVHDLSIDEDDDNLDFLDAEIDEHLETLEDLEEDEELSEDEEEDEKSMA